MCARHCSLHLMLSTTLCAVGAECFLYAWFAKKAKFQLIFGLQQLKQITRQIEIDTLKHR